MNPILTYLEKTGMRQRELAREMGISDPHLHYLANGAKPITPAMAVKFARAIGKPERWRDYISEPEGV